MAPPLCLPGTADASTEGRGWDSEIRPDLPSFFAATLTPAVQSGTPSGPAGGPPRRLQRERGFPRPASQGAQKPLRDTLTGFTFSSDEKELVSRRQCCHPGGRKSPWTPGAALQERPARRRLGTRGKANSAPSKAAEPGASQQPAEGEHARSCLRSTLTRKAHWQYTHKLIGGPHYPIFVS